MELNIKKSQLNGKIDIISSKSYAHRIIISSALCRNEKTKIIGVDHSEDVAATISAISSIGAKFSDDLVESPDNFSDGLIDVSESGTTLRLMLSIAAALGGEYIFATHGTLVNRPNKLLIDVLAEHGLEITGDKIIRLKGKLTPGLFQLEGNISSQYISGLLMALPLLDGDSEIVLTTDLVSKSYVDITIDVLDKFQIEIQRTEKGYFIKGNQKYISPIVLACEGDWSNAAFFILAGLINGEVEISNLNADSLQGDKSIVDVFKQMGGKIEKTDTGLKAYKSQLNGITVDIDQIPDAAPCIAIAAAFAKGETILNNISRLKKKESNRVESIIDMLSNIGIKSFEENNSLHIIGGTPTGGTIKSFNDHRIAMAGAVALTRVGGTLIDSEASSKSYPNYFEELESIGGIID